MMWRIIKHLTVWPFVAAWILVHIFYWERSFELGWGSMVLVGGLMILSYFLGIMWHIVYMGLRVQSLNRELSKPKYAEFISNLRGQKGPSGPTGPTGAAATGQASGQSPVDQI